MKGGTLWRQKKNSKKSHSAEKKSKGGTLCTKFALAGLGALGGFRIVSKKRTDQCEDCSLKKKRSLL